MWRAIITGICLFLASPAWAQGSGQPPAAAPESAPLTPWPTAGWEAAPLPADADARAIESLLSDAFDGPRGPLGETRAVVVIQDGKLVLERYARGYSPDTPLVSWSVAKSFTQAWVGVAARQGLLNPDDAMGSPYWRKGHPLAELSWRTWLQMVDGQRYLEIEAPSIAQSDAAKKLFGDGRRDVARYCAGLPIIHAPRTHWNYNSCGIVLTADALTRRVAPDPANAVERRARMAAWMRASLLDPLGMRSATVEFDAQGALLRQRADLRLRPRLCEVRLSLSERWDVGGATAAA